MFSDTPKLTLKRDYDTSAWRRHTVHDEDDNYVGYIEYRRGYFGAYHVTQPHGFDEAENVYGTGIDDDDELEGYKKSMLYMNAVNAIWRSMHAVPEVPSALTFKSVEIMPILSRIDEGLRGAGETETGSRRLRLREIADKTDGNGNIGVPLEDLRWILTFIPSARGA